MDRPADMRICRMAAPCSEPLRKASRFESPPPFYKPDLRTELSRAQTSKDSAPGPDWIESPNGTSGPRLPGWTFSFGSQNQPAGSRMPYFPRRPSPPKTIRAPSPRQSGQQEVPSARIFPRTSPFLRRRSAVRFSFNPYIRGIYELFHLSHLQKTVYRT